MATAAIPYLTHRRDELDDEPSKMLRAAEELRETELSAVLDAAEHTPRRVILRIVRNA